jgi:membrane protease YdiL (CAAX protease family)
MSKLAPLQLIRVGVLAGIIMMLVAILWAFLVRGENWQARWYPVHNAPQEILLGCVIGIIAIVFAWELTEYIPQVRYLREKLTTSLDFTELQGWHALALGVLAAFPEEMLFRGAMQPTLGIPLTALIFGILHAMSRTYFIYAMGAGLCLGLLAAWRGDLWAATIAHLIYDAGLFLLMRWHVQRNKIMIER